MSEQTSVSAAQLKDAYAVVRGFAFALANGRVYGLDHKVAQQSAADAGHALKAFHERYGDLTLSIVGTEFQSAGASLGPTLSTIAELAKCLANLNAQTLTFQTGITDEEVRAFVKLLFLREDEVTTADGFARLLNTSGLSRIHTVNYSYQRVTEEEAVVAKGARTEPGLDAATAAAISDMLATDSAAPEGKRALEQANLDNERVLAELTKLAAPPESADREGPEAVARQTIERLQRMSDRLLDTPANRTQKGRKAIRKIIKNVEADITDRLQRLGADIQAMEALASRVKEMIEDLAIDGLVAQYMKLRVDVAGKEKRLRRHIARAEKLGMSQEEMKSRFTAIGLPAAVLENLSAGAFGGRGGGGTGPHPHGDGGAAGTERAEPPAEQAPLPGSPLTELLKQLQNTVPGDGTLPQLVERILTEMNKTLQQAATRAAEQIEALKRIAVIPAGRPDNADLSRRQVLVLMAELGQEMRQSLTVIMGAISILLEHHLGDISSEQMPLLEMAAESGHALDDLINRMIHIAGMPGSLRPDEDVLAKIKTMTGSS